MSEITEKISGKLKENCGDAIESADLLYDMLTVIVKKEKVFDVISYLKNEQDLNFHFLTTLCGLHYPQSEQKFGMMYQLHNMPDNIRIRIKSFTSEENPEFISLTSLWGSANWMERETYDFFGFKFKGHPDLRRILNVDDMIGFPLRKEFPLEDQARFDKDDKMFGR
jgi:NADH-quinone oxidoreductase subunit C